MAVATPCSAHQGETPDSRAPCQSTSPFDKRFCSSLLPRVINFSFNLFLGLPAFTCLPRRSFTKLMTASIVRSNVSLLLQEATGQLEGLTTQQSAQGRALLAEMQEKLAQARNCPSLLACCLGHRPAC